MNLYIGKNYLSFLENSIIIGIIMIFSFSSCTKLVEVNGPTTSVNKDYVYNSDATAVAVLNGIYAKMSSGALLDGPNVCSFMPLFPGLSADEFTLFANTGTNIQAFYINALTNTTSPNIWSNTYPYIFTVNSAIEGLETSTGLTPAIKKQLMGEAKFLRAFFYFYLVNLYDNVPLVLTTDYKVNSLISRTDKEDVYKQMIIDLKDAITLLSEDYLDTNVKNVTNERVAPVKWAADALLARVYLYHKDYADAITESNLVINHSALYSLVSLDEVFLANSHEAIWQLTPVNNGWNTEDARLFILPSSGPNDAWPVYLSNNILNAFELGDMRRSKWVDSVILESDGITYYFPYKYKNAVLDNPVTEYKMMLRLAEQYLIRAEAKSEQGDLDGAIMDLNKIRNRAGVDNYNGEINKAQVASAILHEREVELFSEFGHRWLDLKRTNNIDGVMATVAVQKGGSWTSDFKLYPISDYDLQYDKNLVQNPGY